MECYYKGSQGSETFLIDKKSDFFPALAGKMVPQENGRTMTVYAGIQDVGEVSYDIKLRSGTMFITPASDTMPSEYDPEDLEEKYLSYINRDKNSYKFYRMTPGPDGTFEAQYGRCAVPEGDLFGPRTYPWDNRMFHIIEAEKKAKGYVDISEYVLAKDITKDPAPAKNPAPVKTESSRLFARLKKFAKDYVTTWSSVPVNSKLLAKAKELVADLRVQAEADNMDAFNDTLSMLMMILQRAIKTGDGRGVEDALAHSAADYRPIIERETNLLNAMEGLLSGGEEDFSSYGVEIKQADDSDIEFVKGYIPQSNWRNIINVWTISMKKQEKRFKKYVEKRKITDIRFFWHGTKSENLLSILITGLSTNPNASITGHAFGPGNYEAPDFEKACLYTSHLKAHGNGKSRTGFVLLNQCAYGNPYKVGDEYCADFRQTVKTGGYDCLHANCDSSVYREEVVFFDDAEYGEPITKEDEIPSGVLPRYLVEISM